MDDVFPSFKKREQEMTFYQTHMFHILLNRKVLGVWPFNSNLSHCESERIGGGCNFLVGSIV